MFFRFWPQLILFGFGLVSVACGLRVGEKAPEDKPIVIGGSEFSCLSQISEHMQSFVESKLTPKEIKRFGGCVRYSLESFAKHARGLNRDVYTPQEIRDFLHEYFLNGRGQKISDRLLEDLMVVKKTMVGGDLNRVTRADLNEAISFLQFIEEQMLRLNPHMHVYNFSIGRNWAVQNKKVVDSEVEEAVRVLNEVSEAFGRRLGAANSPYPMAHLESLIREFRAFSGWEDVFTNSRSPAAWTSFVRSYKSIVAGGESENIEAKEWRHIFGSAASLYGLSLKTRYAGERQSLMHGEGLEAVIGLAHDGLKLAQSAVDQQQRKIVTYQQMDRMIDSLHLLGLMPKVPSADESSTHHIKPESLKKLLHAFFDRILGDMNIPWRSRQSDGLSSFVITQAREEFDRWAAVQKFLDRTFRDTDKTNTGGRVETLSERLGPVGASQDFMRLMGKDATNGEALSLVRMMEQSLRPLFRPGEDQIFLTESSLLAKYQLVHGFHNLSMMNLSRAVVGLVGRGYSTFRGQAGLLDGGITQEEMQAFYMDFRDFGVDMQLFDPRTDNAGSRSYQEANLFTYTGNGLQRLNEVKNPRDAMMSYTEGMEYLLFILSGGAMGRAVYKGLMDPTTGLCYQASKGAPTSVHGYPMVDRKCFRENLMQVLLPRLTTMPTMRSELEKSSLNERMVMADNLMATTYSAKFSHPDYIEWHEINTIAVIMHYTESVMTRYNIDQDIYLNTDEVWQAYDTFKVYMENMAEARCRQYVEALSNPDSEAARIEFEEAKANGWAGDAVDRVKEQLKKWIRAKGCTNLPDFVSKAAFAHIVKYGEVPTSLWRIHYFPTVPLLGLDFKVDRAGLLKVFAALVKVNAENVEPQPLRR